MREWIGPYQAINPMLDIDNPLTFGPLDLYDYYFEDIDLCLKIRGSGFGVVHVPDAVVGHHVSATMTLEKALCFSGRARVRDRTSCPASSRPWAARWMTSRHWS